MVRLVGGLGLALTIVLGGCGSGGESAATKSVTASSPYVDQLKGLSEANRGLALRRAAQDANLPCKRVVSSGYREDYKNLSVWNLRCSDGEYALFIAPNADVQVRTCKDAATLGLPACRFDGEPTKAS